MFRRTDQTLAAHWWWTVDRQLLGAIIALLAAGLILSFAGSPPVADRLGLNPFHFVYRHILFLIPGIVVLVGVSLLTPRQIRRLAGTLLLVMLAMTAATLIIGEEVKGATRWIDLGVINLQPSEFLKPAFAVVAAWLLSEASRRPDMPTHLLCAGLLGVVVTLLVLQPDFGQTLLILVVWGALLFAAGMSWLWIGALGIVGIGGIVMGYATIPHVQSRIDRFLDPGAHDTFQTDRSIEAVVRGGWFGAGPGEGTVKRVLPDSHTDFVFAVAAEEFGIILCLVLVLLFAFVVLRGLARSMSLPDTFSRLAVLGLVTQVGLQAAINMSVNLNLVPAKGMTLPFVSYGGSSLIALAITMGMVLGLTRKRPHARFSEEETDLRLIEVRP
ncbi:MAG: putative lipid II flippase FtsW [Pseudomonadota bacterium]